MNPFMEALLRGLGMDKQVDRINQGHCPTCDAKIKPDEFVNALSFKEFTISGLCQKCQDEVFKLEEKDV